MQIINTYHKRLTWDSSDFVFTIDANEIKDAPDKIANKLLDNPHIKEVQIKVEKIEPIFSKEILKENRKYKKSK